MKTYKDFIIYKGQDKEVHLPFAVSGFTDFNASFYTDKQYEVLKDASDFDFDGEWASIFFDNTDLDLLTDGVLRYTFNYKIDGVDIVKSTNSAYVLRTPENYSAHTADEVYQEGVDDQKAKLSSITIVENGTYEAEDGYSAVTVNVSGGSSVDVVSTAMTVTGDVQTIESETGKAFSAVTVDATKWGNDNYWGGYNYGISNVAAESVELPVSANGIYDATIGSGGEGYIRRVIVDVDQEGPYNSGYTSGFTDGMVSGTSIGYDEGVAEQKAKLTGVTITENGQYNRPDGYSAVTVNISGGTQEPFFGKVADMTGVGWLMDNVADSTLFEFEFICPNLSGYQNQSLYIASWDDNDENLRCEYYAYDSDTKLKLDSDNTGDDFNINSIINKSVLAKLYKTSGKIDVNVIIPGTMWTTSGDSQCSRNQICFFSMNFWGVMPGEQPRYFKSFRVFDAGNNSNELMHIVPRSDGKMWDLVTNQEATIDWLKYDGTHPTTFNTLYEWEIPQ